MPKRLRSAPAFFLLVLLAPTFARAAEPFAQVGYRYKISSPLLSPRGVRNLGMGATGTASVNPVSTGYFNPATIAWTDGLLLAGEYQDLAYSVSSDDQLAVDVRLSAGEKVAPEWRVAGLVGYNSAGRLNFFAPPEEPASDKFDYMLTVLGAASWTRGIVSIGAGVAAKHLDLYDVDFEATDLSGWAFDLGLLAAFTFDPDWGVARPRIGFESTNLNGGWDVGGNSYSLVGEFRLALGVDIASSTVTVAGRRVPIVSGSVDLDEFHPNDESLWALSVGLELSILDMVQARIGHMDESGADTLYGFGLGWEFGRWMVRGDYAHQSWSWWSSEQSDDTFGLAAGMRL